MKNSRFLFIGLLSFGLLISCGEKNFEPYEGEEGSNSGIALLPVEFTETASILGTTLTDITNAKLSYDEKDRLISEDKYFNNKLFSSHAIIYNEDGTVKEVKVITSDILGIIPSMTLIYTYEYAPNNIILEHINFNGMEAQINTLTVNAKNQLLTEYDAAENELITYKYDLRGNMIDSGEESYIFDEAKGAMSSSKTPHWVIIKHTLYGATFLVNNVSYDYEDEVTYEYKYNVSKYPIEVLINDDEGKMEIKYIPTNQRYSKE